MKRVAFFAKSSAADAPIAFKPNHGWGRTIERDRLEVALVRAAAESGAQVWQPWKITQLKQQSGFHVAIISNGTSTRELTHPIQPKKHSERVRVRFL
ncbi:MAG: hypothetical protein KGJ78_18840 [Alphaproteobacteria bacterium]|nr:hypothetical protein [Alphaproteobacteria bacterium]